MDERRVTEKLDRLDRTLQRCRRSLMDIRDEMQLASGNRLYALSELLDAQLKVMEIHEDERRELVRAVEQAKADEAAEAATVMQEERNERAMARLTRQNAVRYTTPPPMPQPTECPPRPIARRRR